MPLEIERKFLVLTDLWHADPAQASRYRQGYLCGASDVVVRVRTVDDAAFLTIKGATHGITRLEFEYPIPPVHANEMLDALCGGAIIEKTRYRVPFGGRIWEVDVFAGDNAGLVLAEVELSSADAIVDPPPWAGVEISTDSRYSNASLARHPFTLWTSSQEKRQ